MPLTSSDNITELKQNEIFVFGSNLAGIHGAGAAHTAYKYFGAGWGIGEGHTGNCYAIPTKDRKLKARSLFDIELSVSLFLVHAKFLPNYQFLVTEIGCGYAGYQPKEIAPMFKPATKFQNVYLPKSFWKILG